MSSKKKDINKARLTALKSLGVLKDIDARKSLTDNQKKKIRSEYKKYHDLITAPKESYVTKNISHFEKSEIKELRKSGYQIIGDKIYIDKQGYDAASIKRKFIGGRLVTAIERKKGERKTETEIIAKASDKLGLRDRLIREYEDGEFKKGDYIGVKLFENGTFKRAMYQSLDDVFKYLEDDFTPNSDTRDELLNHIHLVRLSVKDYRDLAANERTHKDRGRERYYRAKIRKQKGLTGKVKRK